MFNVYSFMYNDIVLVHLHQTGCICVFNYLLNGMINDHPVKYV